MVFITTKQKKKRNRDAEIYREWRELSSNPANSRTEITKYLMAKHRIKAPSTIWAIRKRLERFDSLIIVEN